MKVIVDENAVAAEPKTEVQLQQEALMQDHGAFMENETALKKHQDNVDAKKVMPEKVAIGTSRSGQLGGSLEQRMADPRTILIEIKEGEKPEVTFTGFWNGRLIHNAQKILSRAYRTRRFKPLRGNPEGGQGDGR